MGSSSDTALIPDDAKAAIKGNVKSGANNVAKRDQLKALGNSIKITIGTDEHVAWKRRNKAAHGVPIAEGKELETIRDMKLLMALFSSHAARNHRRCGFLSRLCVAGHSNTTLERAGPFRRSVTT
jgi:hypothetical protein